MKARYVLIGALCAVLAFTAARATVIIETVPVGNPGNPGELSGSGAGGGWTWTKMFVEDQGGTPSLALDAQGRPHIAITSIQYDQYLRYTTFDGTSWNPQIVDDRWQAKNYPSLAIDSTGKPHISYWISLGCDLEYARWDGAEWDIQTVDTQGNTGQHSTLVLDADDHPHISYTAYLLDIKYSAWNGSNWEHTILGENPAYQSMVRDTQGTIHIAYRDLSHGLMYGTWDGTDWATHAVDNNGQYPGSSCSLALDSQGRPHISYIADSDVRYASWDGTNWAIETVDADENQAGSTSLALDSLDRPRFSYYGQRQLKCAYRNGASWEIAVLHTNGDVGPTSLKLDGLGLPRIAYGVNDGRDIYYVEAVPEPATVDVDIRPSSWPNPLSTRSNGVLPVAVLGTDEFDVMSIDPGTILLAREGFDDSVSPLRWDYEDVATPYEGEPGGGHDLGADGFMDLSLKFDIQALVDAFGLSDAQGESLLLSLSGNLTEAHSGSPFAGSDWIWVLQTGDANGDGFVNASDLTVVLSNWGQSVLSGERGDLNGNGVVDGPDYAEVLSNWAPAEPAQATPEPATVILLAAGGLALLKRRK